MRVNSQAARAFQFLDDSIVDTNGQGDRRLKHSDGSTSLAFFVCDAAKIV